MFQITFYQEAPRLPHPALVDMTGRTVGKLTVVERFVDPLSKTGSARWLCRCTCGEEIVVRGSQLRQAEHEHRDPSCPKCRVVQDREPRVYRRKAHNGHPPKTCPRCAGMRHRVEGPQCRSCGLPFAELPPVRATDLPLRRFDNERET